MGKVTENFYFLLREKNRIKAVKFWFLYISAQCCGCGYGMFISNQKFSIPDPGSKISRIRTKEFKYIKII
jgi:hypothetical protein